MFCCLLAAEAILAAVIFFFFYFRQVDYSYTAADLKTEAAYQTAVQGHAVDGSMEGKERAVITPKMSLNNGVYLVDVNYRLQISGSGSSNNARAWSIPMDVEDKGRYTVDADENSFTDYGQTMTYRFYVHEHSTDVSVHNYISDDMNGMLSIDKITIHYLNLKSALYYMFRVLFGLLLADAVIYILWIRKTESAEWFSKNGLTLAAFAGVLFIVEIPMMMDYIDHGHDLLFHCYRIQELAEGLESGMFPVKIQPGWMNGYGYATGVFYGDFLLYIPAAAYICGFPLHFCYKFYILLVNCLTIGTSFYASLKIAGSRKAAIICSTVYTLSVYRLGDLYTRAAVGEYSSMVFLPLIILGLWYIYSDQTSFAHRDIDRMPAMKKQGGAVNAWLILALGITGVMESHVLTMFMIMEFCVLFFLFMWRKTFRKETILQLLKAVLATLLLNLFFIVPFIDYYLNHKLLNSDVINTLENTTGYLAMIFATRFNAVGEDTFMPLSVGYASGIIIVLVFYMLCRGTFGKQWKTVLKLLILTGISVWMCTNLFPYRFISQHLKLLYGILEKMQFPWRFLAITQTLVFCIAAIGARYAIEKLNSERVMFIGVFICLIVGYQALEFSGSFLYGSRLRIYYTSIKMVGLTDTFQEAGKEYVLYGSDVEEFKNSQLILSDPEEMKAEIIGRKGISIEASVSNPDDKEQYVEFPLQNYKGYRAVDQNGARLNVSNGENNRISVAVSPGYQGNVKVYFAEPWYWRLSEIISLLFTVWIIAAVIRNRSRIPSV